MSRKKRGKRRLYRCKLPVRSRFMFCGYNKAGAHCLKASVWGDRCSKLVISYK